MGGQVTHSIYQRSTPYESFLVELFWSAHSLLCCFSCPFCATNSPSDAYSPFLSGNSSFVLPSAPSVLVQPLCFATICPACCHSLSATVCHGMSIWERLALSVTIVFRQCMIRLWVLYAAMQAEQWWRWPWQSSGVGQFCQMVPVLAQASDYNFGRIVSCASTEAFSKRSFCLRRWTSLRNCIMFLLHWSTVYFCVCLKTWKMPKRYRARQFWARFTSQLCSSCCTTILHTEPGDEIDLPSGVIWDSFLLSSAFDYTCVECCLLVGLRKAYTV